MLGIYMVYITYVDSNKKILARFQFILEGMESFIHSHSYFFGDYFVSFFLLGHVGGYIVHIIAP